MKRLLPLVVVFIFSCSKQESAGSADSALSPTDAQQRTVVELSPEQVEVIAWAILLKFHDDNLMGDADLMAYIEELAVEGDHILYKLVRHNGDDAGWRSGLTEDEDPPYAEELAASEGGEPVEETEEERTAREMEEEMAGDAAADSQAYAERYGGPAETPVWYYTNELDTFSYDGNYVAYLEKGAPESPVKTVRIVFTGKMHRGYFVDGEGYDEPVDEPRKIPGDYSISDILVEVGTPLLIDRSQLYLKAKITDLAERDVAGMTKDELGYLRNEIFARHGHTFRTPKMNDYFESKRWYHPIDSDAAPLLNKFEKRNVELIRKKEG
jgi:hypothetical protein